MSDEPEQPIRRMAWHPLFSKDPEAEERAAERVAYLEWRADQVDPAEAARLIAEADELRAEWKQPRDWERFGSVEEAAAELEAIVKELPELDITDADSVYDRAHRLQEVGSWFEWFATDLETVHGADQGESDLDLG